MIYAGDPPPISTARKSGLRGVLLAANSSARKSGLRECCSPPIPPHATQACGEFCSLIVAGDPPPIRPAIVRQVVTKP